MATTARLESTPAADRYFCTLSPLCRRIISNVQTVSESAPQDHWNRLSYVDQCDDVITANGSDVSQCKRKIPGNLLLDACSTAVTVEQISRLCSTSGDADKMQVIKIVEDEDPETGRKVKWRDEHAAPFSWRTPSQERMAVSALPGSSTAMSPVRRPAALRCEGFSSTGTRGRPAERHPSSSLSATALSLRDSIRRRVAKVEKLYQGSPRRTAASDDLGGFDHPSLVLGGSSAGRRGPVGGCDDAAGGGGPAGQLKRQLLAGIARGRRVLLSITRSRRGGGRMQSPGDDSESSSRLGQWMDSHGRRAGRSVSPPVSRHRPAAAAESRLSQLRRRASSAAAAPSRRPSISRPVTVQAAAVGPPRCKPSSPPPPPPAPRVEVQVDMVAIRVSRDPYGPLSVSRHNVTDEEEEEEEQLVYDEPIYGQLRTPPPQLKKVAPPVVPRPAAGKKGGAAVSAALDKFAEVKPLKIEHRKSAEENNAADNKERVNGVQNGIERPNGLEAVHRQLKAAIVDGGGNGTDRSSWAFPHKRQPQIYSTFHGKNDIGNGNNTALSATTSSTAASVTAAVSTVAINNQLNEMLKRRQQHLQQDQSRPEETDSPPDPGRSADRRIEAMTKRNSGGVITLATLGSSSEDATGDGDTRNSWSSDSIASASSCSAPVVGGGGAVSLKQFNQSKQMLNGGGVEQNVLAEERMPVVKPFPGVYADVVDDAEDIKFCSVLEQPSQVDIKTGFDFLDNW